MRSRSPRNATIERATASPRPTVINGIAAVMTDRYTTNNSTAISTTVTPVIINIWVSMAVSSSAMVAPGPVTQACVPGGAGWSATILRTAANASFALAAPSSPLTRSIV
ncbi:Uncharacterised protein [Mycobacteroides abscessus subsp. abscessus]|nr:Uncharacterised protein [Mycobacteroides abscessus subsp. abscessus]